MPRARKPDRLTPLELEIMEVLWRAGPATVQTVLERLPRTLAYTTVQTMLNILVRKGKARRVLKARAYLYRTAIARSQVVGQTIGDMVDRLFGGSAESLVLTLVETRRLTPRKLARLQKMVEQAERNST